MKSNRNFSKVICEECRRGNCEECYGLVTGSTACECRHPVLVKRLIKRNARPRFIGRFISFDQWLQQEGLK